MIGEFVLLCSAAFVACALMCFLSWVRGYMIGRRDERTAWMLLPMDRVRAEYVARARARR